MESVKRIRESIGLTRKEFFEHTGIPIRILEDWEAEVIYERADSNKPFMGLTTFTGDFPTKKDIGVAKNYLDEKELKVLNNIRNIRYKIFRQ